MNVSVIVPTCAEPEWLQKVLVGYLCQNTGAFELLVADLGGWPATGSLLQGIRREARFPVRSVWHEERGASLALALNRAVAAAEGDYLVLAGGHAIPRVDFVSTHVRLAAGRRFVAGGIVAVPRETSEAISLDDVRTGRFARPGWLRSHGARLGREALRLVPPGRTARLLDRLSPLRPSFDPGNVSTWKDAVIECGGFEARGADGIADLGPRLGALGLNGAPARHQAVVVRLDPGGHGRRRAALGSRERRERREILPLDGILDLPPDPAATMVREVP